jgi:hypothetical protein
MPISACVKGGTDGHGAEPFLSDVGTATVHNSDENEACTRPGALVDAQTLKCS